MKEHLICRGTPESLGIALDDFGRVEYSAGEVIKPHIHGHPELCLLTGGQAIYEVEGHSYSLKPGDICVTRPGEMHSMRSASDEADATWNLDFVIVRHVDDDLLAALNRPGPKVIEKCTEAFGVFDDIFAEVAHPQYCATMMVHCLAIRLILLVIRRLGTDMPFEFLNPYSRPVMAVMYYFMDNASFAVTLSEVAKYAGCSVSALAHAFKRETGMTVRTYMRNVIMERARRSLEEGRYSVSAIADSLGFRDLATFSAFFRKHEGCAPSHYKRRWSGR